MDKVFETFLRQQVIEAKSLARESDILNFTSVKGDLGQYYIADYHAKGLIQSVSSAQKAEVKEETGFSVGIWLPDDYLRCVEVGQVLTYLGPHVKPWHPNIRPPFICIHLKPATPLVELLYTCYELWTWSLYYTGDEGLNHDASQWARHQNSNRFPIDPRPLKRRTLDCKVGEGS